MSNFDSLLNELAERQTERARVGRPVRGQEVVRKSAHDLGAVMAGLRAGAARMRRIADRAAAVADADPVLKAMAAEQRRAAARVPLDAVAAKIEAAARSGAITAAQASRLELELNHARRRVA